MFALFGNLLSRAVSSLDFMWEPRLVALELWASYGSCCILAHIFETQYPFPTHRGVWGHTSVYLPHPYNPKNFQRESLPDELYILY